MALEAASAQLDLAPPKPWRRFMPGWLRSLIWLDSAARYDAFLSYSWQADSPNRAVHTNRPFHPSHRARLSQSGSQRRHGDGSRHWFSKSREGEVLIIVTDGEVKTWGQIRDQLLPATVRDKLGSEPLWIPLQHRRRDILSDPNSHKLRGQLIEDLKQVFLRLYAPRTWEELQGEEGAQRHRVLWMMSAAALLFLALAVAALRFAIYAQKQSMLAQQRQQQAEAAATRERTARNAETTARQEADLQRKNADDNAAKATRQEQIANENEAKTKHGRIVIAWQSCGSPQLCAVSESMTWTPLVDRESVRIQL